MRLRATDPPAPTLALVAGLALHRAVAPLFGNALNLKWPNDLLADGRKLAGILLERVDTAVIIGFGLNIASYPDDSARPATSLAASAAATPHANAILTDLARSFAAVLATWRQDVDLTRTAWLAAAHPLGTALATHGMAGEPIAGTFDGLDATGACRLRLADGNVRLIHAGDVFLG